MPLATPLMPMVWLRAHFPMLFFAHAYPNLAVQLRAHRTTSVRRHRVWEPAELPARELPRVQLRVPRFLDPAPRDPRLVRPEGYPLEEPCSPLNSARPPFCLTHPLAPTDLTHASAHRRVTICSHPSISSPSHLLRRLVSSAVLVNCTHRFCARCLCLWDYSTGLGHLLCFGRTRWPVPIGLCREHQAPAAESCRVHHNPRALCREPNGHSRRSITAATFHSTCRCHG